MVLAFVVAGSVVFAGVSPAIASGGTGASSGSCSKEKTAKGAAAAAARAKAEAAKRKRLEQRCTKANKALNAAVESAAKAMRGSLKDFHGAVEDSDPPLADEQLEAMALVAQGKLGDALAAGMAAVMAAHDAALADLTAAGAPQATLDKLEKQTACAKNRLQKLSDCAGRKLAEMLADALAENDAPADPPTPDDSSES
jgi:hypothetical protein